MVALNRLVYDFSFIGLSNLATYTPLIFVSLDSTPQARSENTRPLKLCISLRLILFNLLATLQAT